MAGDDIRRAAGGLIGAEEFMGDRDRGRDQQGLGDGGIADSLRIRLGSEVGEIKPADGGQPGNPVGEGVDLQPLGQETGGLSALTGRGNRKHVIIVPLGPVHRPGGCHEIEWV